MLYIIKIDINNFYTKKINGISGGRDSYKKFPQYLKAQLRGISSFNRTSLMLPLGQYSIKTQKFAASVQQPTNLHRF